MSGRHRLTSLHRTVLVSRWCFMRNAANAQRTSRSSSSVKTSTMSVSCTFKTRKLESNTKHTHKKCTVNVFLVPFLPWNHILVPLYLFVVCKKCCYICCIDHVIHCRPRYWFSLASLPKVFCHSVNEVVRQSGSINREWAWPHRPRDSCHTFSNAKDFLSLSSVFHSTAVCVWSTTASSISVEDFSDVFGCVLVCLSCVLYAVLQTKKRGGGITKQMKPISLRL